MMRRNWVASPAELYSRAAEAWRQHGDLLFGELGVLLMRATQLHSDTADEDWAVAAATVADLMIDLEQRELRQANRADRATLIRIIDGLQDDRAGFGSGDEFELRVEEARTRVLGGT